MKLGPRPCHGLCIWLTWLVACVDQGKGYAWEGSFERSWDGIEEDESGALKLGAFMTSSGDKSRLRRQEMLQRVRKGMHARSGLWQRMHLGST